MRRWWLTLLLVNVTLIATALPRTGGTAMPWLAVDGLMLIAALSLWPGHRHARHGLGYAAGALIAIVVLGAVGNTITQEIRGRLFNPYLDPAQLPIFLELLRDNLGLATSLVLVAVAIVGLLAIGGGLGHLLATLPRPRRTSARLTLVGVLVVSAGLVLLGPTRHTTWLGTPGVGLLADQVTRAYATHAAVRDFDAQLTRSETPLDAPEGHPLPGLAGRDVILAFVESYGMAALERTPFAAPVNQRLDAMAETFERAGLSVASGRLVSPTLGGQSRLAHASVLSGLWIDSTLRYDLLLESPRATLVDDFERSGHTSVR